MTGQQGVDTPRDGVARITDRRTRACDPDLERIPEHPTEVARYVAHHQHVPTGVLHADLVDALHIIRAARHELDLIERTLIRSACSTGMTWAALADPLGVSSRQGAQQYARRLDEHLTDPDGRRDATAAAARIRRQDDDRSWLAANGNALRVAARALVADADTLPDMEWLEEITALAAETTGNTEALRAYLSLTLPELADVRPVPPSLARCRELLADYARAG